MKLMFQKMNLKTKVEKDEAVSFVDVYQEFNDKIAEKYRIMKFKSMVSTTLLHLLCSLFFW